MKPYRAAVVGLGKIGWLADQDERRPEPRSHVGAWRFCLGAKLAAACDDNHERAAEASAALNIPVFEDAVALLARETPDIVSVATPPDRHREVVEACVRARTPLVVCEKPLAQSAKDALAMVEACREAGTVLLVNHGRRFHPMIRRVKADLDDGRIGRPLSAIAACSGGLWSGASHMADLLQWFLGEIGWSAGYRRGVCAEDGIELGYDGHLWFRSGAAASLHAVDIRRYVTFALTVFGEEGILALDEAGLRARWGRADDSYPLAGGYRHVVADEGIEAGPTTFLGEMAAHAVAVLDGREVPTSTGEDGLACVQILEAIEQSHAAGGRLIVLGTP